MQATVFLHGRAKWVAHQDSRIVILFVICILADRPMSTMPKFDWRKVGLCNPDGSTSIPSQPPRYILLRRVSACSRLSLPTMILLRQPFKGFRLSSCLRNRMSSSATPQAAPMEEERSPNYDPAKYYPARIGETIGKYRIISKLGWGANSTAWLAKDISRSVDYLDPNSQSIS